MRRPCQAGQPAVKQRARQSLCGICKLKRIEELRRPVEAALDWLVQRLSCRVGDELRPGTSNTEGAFTGVTEPAGRPGHCRLAPIAPTLFSAGLGALIPMT